MSEMQILELLGRARDIARAHAQNGLAEHLDDAMLVAASAFHEAALLAGDAATHGVEGGDALRGAARPGIH